MEFLASVAATGLVRQTNFLEARWEVPHKWLIDASHAPAWVLLLALVVGGTVFYLR